MKNCLISQFIKPILLSLFFYGCSNSKGDLIDISGKWRLIDTDEKVNTRYKEVVYTVTPIADGDSFNADDLEIGEPGSIRLANYKGEASYPDAGKNISLIIYYDKETKEYREKPQDAALAYRKGEINFENLDKGVLTMKLYMINPVNNKFESYFSEKYDLVRIH